MDLDLQHDEFHPAKCPVILSSYIKIIGISFQLSFKYIYNYIELIETVIIYNSYIDRLITELQCAFLHVCDPPCAKKIAKRHGHYYSQHESDNKRLSTMYFLQ
jgi:hypothetical protein